MEKEVIPNSNIPISKTHFNLEKPEGRGENKKRGISLKEGKISTETTFDKMNRTGELLIDESGKERVVRSVKYDISENITLNVRGRSYDYRDKLNNQNNISAEYNKNTGELVKMHFKSESPIFAGRAIMDMVERIPVGAEILGGEVSMSTDSFPLLLNAISKHSIKNPDRFLVLEIGEILLNNQGKFSEISKSETVEQKVELLNKSIVTFEENTKTNIRRARLEEVDGNKEIMIPKIKVVKKY